MKKFLWLLLVTVLLTGCTQQVDPNETVDLNTEPVSAGTYIPESEVESSTGGALLAYDITGLQLFPVNNGVAVYNDRQELVVLKGRTGYVHTTVANVKDLQLVSDTAVYYYSDGLYSYDWESAQTAAWQLPAEIVGNYVVSPVTQEIFYSTEDQICALHMETGLSRLIREHAYTNQSLEALLFDGQVLVWNTEAGVLYVSTENGMTLDTQAEYDEIASEGDRFFLYRMDGIIEQWIYGQRKETPGLLQVAATKMAPDFDRNGVVALDADGVFSYYDLNTAKRTASLTLPNGLTCLDFVVSGDFVWILAEQGLYCWDVSQSAVQDDRNYGSRLWTAEFPDEQALALCRQEAERISETYHVPVLIGREAVEFAPDLMEPEYQAPALEKMLAELEKCLQQLPEGFLDATVQYGGLHISLVRKVDSSRGYGRYWQAGNCNIAISVYADTRTAFFTGLGGVIETRILGNSRDLEYWEDNNPVGFKYSYTDEPLEEYLSYIPMFFPCELAMTYPTEDRASVFCYAMAADSAEVFSSSFMQKKLKAFCEGIREAYDLNDSTDTFPWEQYLETPLV